MNRRTKNGAGFVAAAAAALLMGRSAMADISGFSGFSLNTAGSYSGVGFTGSSTFEVTDGNTGEATSAFFPVPQNITSFVASFTYTVPGGNNQNPQYSQADGFDFVVQNDPAGAAALGGGGGDKGYGGIVNSAALGIEMFDGDQSQITINNGPTQGNGTFAVNNGDPLQIQVAYLNNALSISAYDPATGEISFASQGNVNLVSAVGGTTALVGITGGTGGAASTQIVSNFVFHSASSLTYTPIQFTSSSFNQAMVLAAGAPTTGASSYITATMDAGTAKTGSTFYEMGYDPTNTGGNTGLPASGSTFVSQNDPNHTFQMQSYAPGNNDAMLLDLASPSGTMTFATPEAMTALSFLASTGNANNGAGPFSVTINYANGDSSVIPFVISPDWFGNAPVAWDAEGRAYPDPVLATGYDNIDNGNPNLYEIDVPLTDTTDPIASLTLNYIGTSQFSQVAIYGVSGDLSVVPEPASLSLIGLTLTGLLARRRRRAD